MQPAMRHLHQRCLTFAVCVAIYTILLGTTLPAVAQVSCDTLPAGPARTDCYIGLSRIGAGNAAIAGTRSQLATDSGILREATGQSVAKKSARKKSARRMTLR